MTSPSDPAPSDIPSLLQRGLDHYGRNENERAVACWLKVLRQDSHHPDALDYLDAADVGPTDPRVEALQSPVTNSNIESTESAQVIDFDSFRTHQASTPPFSAPKTTEEPTTATESATAVVDRTRSGSTAPQLDLHEIENLLSEHRHEEVLTLLYTARKRSPRDASISRSIRHVREQLTNEYAYRLVDLDRVPLLAPGSNWSSLASADWGTLDPVIAREARQLAPLVDGISTFGDIVGSSPLGQLSALRGLCVLLDRAHIQLPRETGASFVPAPPPFSLTAPPDTRTVLSQDTPAPCLQMTAPVPRHSAKQAPEPQAHVPPPPPESPLESGPAATQSRAAQIQAAQIQASMEAARRPVRTASGEVPVGEDAYRTLFKQATHAYLLRDFDRAIALFKQCCDRRPDDRRPRHNLEALMRRVGKL